MNPKVYDKAIALLNIRMHTTGELFQKLKQKGFQPTDIQEALRELEGQKFLNDQKFAEIFVENMKRYKDWGFYGIKGKLLARHIPSSMAEAALAEFFGIADEEQVARRLIGKLRRQGRDTFEKLARSLQSKGFRSEVIRKVMNK
ncbi:MAG: RecX family transcriptional regulator [Candidatus Doudnabacteria bacterium]|nr:RecX family transcriptional regulator [Candidatus Doudnabacteria bacterium]